MAHCLDWRFEALSALVSQPEFKQQRADLDRRLTEELFQLLKPLLPTGDPRDLIESIGLNITRPALDLAHRLQLSTTIYSVRWTPFHDDLNTGRIDETRVDFSHYVCLNLLQRGKLVKVKEGTESGAPLRVQYLFDVCPGLYCEVLQDGHISDLKSISKPKILVAASEGSRVLPAQGRTILQWLDHCARLPPQVKTTANPDVPKKTRKGLGRFLKA
jgi:hypothetical protein